jgi:autotransporter strand-loop-strand O-heptosyltransferase
MQKGLFNYIIKDGFLSIKNLENRKVSTKILLFGVSYQCIIDTEAKFEPFEEKIFGMMISPFHEVDMSHKMTLRIYENGIKVVDDFVSTNIERAFILISNDKYEEITSKLLDGLQKYSNIPILHYSINYESKLNYKNLTNIRFDVPGDSDQQYMQFMKAPVFIDVIERGIQNAVFLDSDIQVRPNIDELFDIPQITPGPIIQKQRWDYVIANGIYIPGPQVSNFMGFDIDNFKQPYPNGITFLVIFNSSHLELFKEWKKVCFSDEIQTIRKTEFLHDELLLNCLLWKNQMPPNLITVGLNVRNEKDVNFFYQHPNLTGDFLLDMNDWKLGHYSQSHIPFDKNDILFFHCVKESDIADNINQIIEMNDCKKNNENTFKDKLINFYKNIDNKKSIKKLKPNFSVLFHDGAFLEVRNTLKDYDVKFIDKSTENIVYDLKLQNNSWAKTSLQYFVHWKIVAENDEDKFEYELDFTGQRVLITFESSALGDTLAWIPYVDEFRKRWNCQVFCSTFWNNLFENSYPEINFIKPGQSVPNVLGVYRIGWFYDGEQVRITHHKNNFRLQPMQKTATDILGLDFTEIKPKLNLDTNITREKIITIGIHGTAQTKYWNNPDGWQKITDHFISQGYEVIILSKEGDDYMGNKHPKGAKKANTSSIEEVIKYMQRSTLFIGIGSGLSWLSWATKTPTVLISGFSYNYTEPQNGVIRINASEGKCSGCFNDFRLDPGDWNWCPTHKGTQRQFECTKSITAEMVISQIEKSGILNQYETNNEWSF